jgi:hypothetical protein
VIHVTPFSRIVEDDTGHESEGPSRHLIISRELSPDMPRC